MRQAKTIASLMFALSAAIFPLSVSFRFSDEGTGTRIVFEGSEKFTYKIQSLEDRLEIAIAQPITFKEDSVRLAESRMVARVVAEARGNQTLLTTYFKDGYRIQRHFVLENPFRLVFDLEQAPRPAARTETAPPPGTPQLPVVEKAQLQPPAAGQEAKPPLPGVAAKKKPIETICIDSGHGGSDLGALGKSNALEKNITLAVARMLKNLIESKLGLRVIMTREKDEEVSLNARAAIANNQQAQLFVSIHVNSSFRRTAFGSETYFVSLSATDQDALELAQKENSSNDNIGAEIQNDELKLILWNMAQTEYIKESSKLAEFIQFELNELLGTRNRGVKQAPFRVLMRAAMPSVLIEVAFLSNRGEEKRLLDEDFQRRVALAIFSGMAKFIAYHNSTLK